MSDEASPIRRAAPANTVKRGLAWVLAMGAGAFGLFAGYAIGARQTQIACLTNLEANCPKLPVVRPQAARGKGNELRFYDELTPEHATVPDSGGRSPESRPQEGNQRAPRNVVSAVAQAPNSDIPNLSRPQLKSPTRVATEEKQAPRKPAEASSQRADIRTSRSLQFGSFPTQVEAESLATRLRAHDLPVRVVEKAGPNKSKWYKVWVGPYPSVNAASQAKLRLGAGGTTAVLVKDSDGPQ